MRGLFLYFLRLGSAGFGGPIALAGYMRRDLVEERGWFSDEEYQQGLAIAQTMPGPLAAQLAMWLGYLERGARGALLVALPFIVPPFLLVTAVAALYAHYQGLSQVQSVFFGVGPAVLAIVAIAAYKLARSTNKHDPLLWAIATIVCASTAISGSEIVWLFLAAGFFGALYYGGGLPRLRGGAAALSPVTLATVKGFAWLAAAGSLGTLALFFAKASALTFGSGLAVVPFLQPGPGGDHGHLRRLPGRGRRRRGRRDRRAVHADVPIRRRPRPALPSLRAPPAPAGVRQGRDRGRSRRDRRRRDRDRPADDPRLALGGDRRRRARAAAAETAQGGRAGARRGRRDRRPRPPLAKGEPR
ncbi:MAG TPA: chromate efflux transporter [Gaiellaceae bacterium]|nr:chromate efflux transporter [Gaiellaceae bacterium]